MRSYSEFIASKSQFGEACGFDPVWLPDVMFGFQSHLAEWAIRRGRAAVLGACGLGKSLIELVWAENVVRHTNRPVLLLTPLAVTSQMTREGDKFGVRCVRANSAPSRYEPAVYVTNYEKLHHFDSSAFAGVVGDESGILKSFVGKTRRQVTRFLSKVQYRLLATATPSPNDYVELGNTSEALGELTHTDMLRRFFAYCDDKKQRSERKKQAAAEATVAANPNYFKKLAFRIAQTIGQWRLRHHAVTEFWRWVCSWARACRKPSDLGFPDTGYELPPLTEEWHTIDAGGEPAVGLYAERQERKRTLTERCEYVARLVDHDRPAVAWCHTNDEGDLLTRVIDGAEQVSGRTPDERKVELYEAFSSWQLKKLVIKPKIGAWGLNWQHCDHTVTFPTHSYESHHQLVARFHRFGQANPVKVDVVATSGEMRVVDNLKAKAHKMELMYAALVEEMNRAVTAKREDLYTAPVEVPPWLSA